MTTLSATGKRPSVWLAAAGALLLAACQTPPATQTATASSPNWVATWASSPSTFIPGENAPPGMSSPTLEGTVRYLMRVSAGGEKVRVVIDAGPSVPRLAIGAASVAILENGVISEDSFRTLTFSGRPDALLVSAGAALWSDPVELSVPAGAVLAVSLHLPEPVRVARADPQLIVEMAEGGDQTRLAALTGATRFVASPLVAALHVENPDVNRVVVAFGDSITDGTGSKDPLVRGWPDYLAERMRAEGMSNVAIANHGIGGNRLLRDSVGQSALARFDRDVLTMPGVTDVVILEGINDLGLSGLSLPGMSEPFPELAAEDIINAYKQLIARGHARGIRVIGATLTPDLGSPFPGYATEAKDAIRHEINEWIRTSGAFDAVIDFDLAVRDPENPQYLAEKYNSGDLIHPSDAGYRAMAEAIDLDLFR